MWEASDDILDLDSTPEMRAASDLLLKAAESIAEYSVPLKKVESACATSCFDGVKDHWNMPRSQLTTVMSCIEKCEEPMEAVGVVVDDERNKIVEATTNCLERCSEEDEVCGSRCITSTISQDRVQNMVDRVRSRIDRFRY